MMICFVMIHMVATDTKQTNRWLIAKCVNELCTRWASAMLKWCATRWRMCVCVCVCTPGGDGDSILIVWMWFGCKKFDATVRSERNVQTVYKLALCWIKMFSFEFFFSMVVWTLKIANNLGKFFIEDWIIHRTNIYQKICCHTTFYILRIYAWCVFQFQCVINHFLDISFLYKFPLVPITHYKL